MSLFIKVYVGSKDNHREVASCHAYNTSDLAETSDYNFTSKEYGYTPLEIPSSEIEGKISGHTRASTVWSLVEKIARVTQNGLD